MHLCSSSTITENGAKMIKNVLSSIRKLSELRLILR